MISGIGTTIDGPENVARGTLLLHEVPLSKSVQDDKALGNADRHLTTRTSLTQAQADNNLWSS